MIIENEKGLAFRIEHPTGYIEVTLDGFFPCPVQQARKYCSQAEMCDLYEELCVLQDRYPDKIRAMAAELGNPDIDPADFEAVLTKLRLLRRDRISLALNIRDAAGILGVK